jgi:Ca2+-binding RTX toxin-like protein
LSGSTSNDTIHGGAGNDVIHGGQGGADMLYGDAGNDLFVFGDVSGNTHVDGGAGGNWTDVVEIDMGHGPASSAHGSNWTLEIDGQKIVDGHDAHGSIDTQGHSGTITTDHGTISFDNIDKIQW